MRMTRTVKVSLARTIGLWVSSDGAGNRSPRSVIVFMLAPMTSLSAIAIHRLSIPLIVPYRLAFGPQTHFHCTLVELTDADGRAGWGEAALLPGYNDETPDASFARARAMAARIKGLAPDDARAMAETLLDGAAFTATAFLSALEHLAGHPTLARSGSVPLLGTVNTKPDDIAALEAEIEGLLAAGYRTLKVKIGWEVAADRRAVDTVRSIVADRARLRLDGNQGYSTRQALAFLDGFNPAGIELLEQPCAAGDWDAAVAVKRAAACPVMLDESIHGEDDIRRAADLGCADYIKLKLMKLGGLDRLERALGLIRDLGMRPVLGNGVASDLGCWMEACVAARAIDNAGEMNGFLKPRIRLLTPPLSVEGGCIRLDGRAPGLERAALKACSVATYSP